MHVRMHAKKQITSIPAVTFKRYHPRTILTLIKFVNYDSD